MCFFSNICCLLHSRGENWKTVGFVLCFIAWLVGPTIAALKIDVEASLGGLNSPLHLLLRIPRQLALATSIY